MEQEDGRRLDDSETSMPARRDSPGQLGHSAQSQPMEREQQADRAPSADGSAQGGSVQEAGESAQSEQSAQALQAEKPLQSTQQEKLNYTRPDGTPVQVPIVRAGMPDLFVALQPPQAEPYVMAPRDLEPQAIVDFFTKRVKQVEELRADMLKRYTKSPSRKCRYQTGDVAYVMGRPFQLRVYPLGQRKERPKAGARGRSTSKYSIDAGISLLTLYVVHPRNYDEAKLAFNGYAEGVLLRNAKGLTADFSKFLTPDGKVPPVRMRAMRDRWSSDEAGALWLSTDLIPYPPDCLVYIIWRELEKKSSLPSDQISKRFEKVLPGWRQAQKMLANRVEPYSLQ